jgi:hypothetical protein
MRHALDEPETALRFVDAITDSVAQVRVKVCGCACLGFACHVYDEIARLDEPWRSGRRTIYAIATRYLHWGEYAVEIGPCPDGSRWLSMRW